MKIRTLGTIIVSLCIPCALVAAQTEQPEEAKKQMVARNQVVSLTFRNPTRQGGRMRLDVEKDVVASSLKVEVGDVITSHAYIKNESDYSVSIAFAGRKQEPPPRLSFAIFRKTQGELYIFNPRTPYRLKAGEATEIVVYTVVLSKSVGEFDVGVKFALKHNVPDRKKRGQQHKTRHL